MGDIAFWKNVYSTAADDMAPWVAIPSPAMPMQFNKMQIHIHVFLKHKSS